MSGHSTPSQGALFLTGTQPHAHPLFGGNSKFTILEPFPQIGAIWSCLPTRISAEARLVKLFPQSLPVIKLKLLFHNTGELRDYSINLSSVVSLHLFCPCCFLPLYLHRQLLQAYVFFCVSIMPYT